MNKIAPSLLLATALALGLSPARTMATPNIRNQTQTQENTGSGSFFLGAHNQTGGYTGTPLPDSFSYAGPIVTLDVSAQYGLLQSKVLVDVDSAPGTFESGNGSTSMRWDDFATISAPGLDGQSGTLNVRLLLNGSVAHIGNETWDVYFDLYLGGGNVEAHYYSNGTLPLVFSDTPLALSMPFTFGTAFNVGAAITNRSGSKSVSNGASQYYHGDLTAQWDGGFLSVLDGSSAAVSNFTMTSESGFNYAQAAPEPSSAMLVALAMVTLGTVRARANHRARSAWRH